MCVRSEIFTLDLLKKSASSASSIKSRMSVLFLRKHEVPEDTATTEQDKCASGPDRLPQKYYVAKPMTLAVSSRGLSIIYHFIKSNMLVALFMHIVNSTCI